MDYIKLTCTIESINLELAREVLMQELADAGFESFEETRNGLHAYIQSTVFSDSLYRSLSVNVLDFATVSYTYETIKDRNWNEEWEQNFQPVLIADKCYIRAPFHPANHDVRYEIVMEPKMAFGTGHHETTSLMIEQMLSLDFKGKQVLDMGCGTGVLGIMASMLGADGVLAIDIDEWSYKSSMENCCVNNIGNVTVKLGDIELISGETFDVILANINRNILLNQIPHYAKALKTDGLLLMSGIYSSDFDIIRQAAEDNGFVHLIIVEKNNWIAVLFKKN